MYKIYYTHKSRRNLEEISKFIALDNSYYAQKVIERITFFVDSYLSLFEK